MTNKTNKLSIKITALLSLLMVLSCGGLCVFSYYDRTGYAATADEAAIAGLPQGATDIVWHLPGAFEPNTHYEFTCTEEEFQQWAKAYASEKLQGPKEITEYASVYVIDKTTFEREYKEVNRLIRYEWSYTDQGVYLTFDPEAKRAYFFSHTR